MTNPAPRRTSRLWRMLLRLARVVVALVGRLEVTGEVPSELRGGPLVLASNHIGLFDPIALGAASRSRGMTPAFLATAGLFRAPVVGAVLRRCGHIQVDRRNRGGGALGHAANALGAGAVVAAYPEGRISLDPGLWPERPKTGVARLALATGAPVIPVAQWGAHEVLAWAGWWAAVRSVVRAIVCRPVIKVAFGAPVDLSGLSVAAPGDVQRAAERISAATVELLRPLRADEPDSPRFADRTRPVSADRALLSHEP